MSKLLVAATLVTAAWPLAFDGRPAQATTTVVPDRTFHFPEITKGPDPGTVLFKRDEGDSTVLIGPDNTCGYVDGRPGAPITCNNDYTCAIVIQQSDGRAGCCTTDDCGIRQTCYDARQLSTSGLCNGGCLQDTYTLKCTESTARYCNTITFFSGVIDYFCGVNEISTPQQLYTTYNGQTDAQTWQEFIFTASDSVSGGGSGSDSATTDGSFVISFTSEASPSGTGASGGNNNNGGGNNGNNNNGGNGGNNSDNSQMAEKSSTPVGPIVGGVVGGVGGIALIGLAIFLFFRHNNKKKAAAASQQPMQQTAAAGGVPPPSGAPGYPPQGYNAPYGQQPYQQQPPPQQAYYPTGEQKPAGFVGITPTGVPDRHDSTSPVSQFTDPRHSTQPHSPTSTLNANWGPQQGQPPSPNVPPNVVEAGGNVVGERDYNAVHRGQFHEMG